MKDDGHTLCSVIAYLPRYLGTWYRRFREVIDEGITSTTNQFANGVYC